MDTEFLVNGAKALVPSQLRPIYDKESWGKPLLSMSQFLGLGSVLLLALVSGLLLYYSFYVAFILSSVETFEPLPPISTEKRIAGSYSRTMRYMKSRVGLGHFMGGVRTYLWTALLAYLGRQALTAWVLSPTPSKDSSVLSLLGGPEMISAFFLEPFNIVFTHKILTASRFSSMGTLFRLIKSQDLYTTLVYIGSIRMIASALQNSLMVSNKTEHYQYPFLTFTSYILIFLFRVALVTRAHASLLPADAVTTVDIRQPTQFRIGYRLYQMFIRALWMFKLLFVCAILGALHLVLCSLTLLYASGQLWNVWAWVTAPKQSNSRPAVRDPHMGMGYDPEMDPHHRH